MQHTSLVQITCDGPKHGMQFCVSLEVVGIRVGAELQDESKQSGI